jgi:hypothetical protein
MLSGATCTTSRGDRVPVISAEQSWNAPRGDLEVFWCFSDHGCGAPDIVIFRIALHLGRGVIILLAPYLSTLIPNKRRLRIDRSVLHFVGRRLRLRLRLRVQFW